MLAQAFRITHHATEPLCDLYSDILDMEETKAGVISVQLSSHLIMPNIDVDLMAEYITNQITLEQLKASYKARHITQARCLT